jgi:cyclase
MISTRVIPVLLLQNHQLVKTTQFKNPKYIGDCINALKIFNEKGADELVILDIGAANAGKPDFEFVEQLVSECFMPLAYGGGIQTTDHAQRLFSLGIEKAVIGAAAHTNPSLVNSLSQQFGSQSVVVSIDVKKDWLNRPRVYIQNGKKNTGIEPVHYAQQMESLGAGELIVQSIDREGTGSGYDLELITQVSKDLKIPVVALGGASAFTDFGRAKQAGASAVAAGSLFVFKGPHKAVLISYPGRSELKGILS